VDVPKRVHEIRDPIHSFIRLDSDERKVVDSRPFQRLRYIHQLAMTYLIYPGATHRRFEHSLGVMDLASRVYDIVTDPTNLRHDSVRGIVPQWREYDHFYWRRVLRMAALCHDLGHLPFSHAAEQDLLPSRWSHERLSVTLIQLPEMQNIWSNLKINPSDVAMLAVGPKHYARMNPGTRFTDWQALLAEIITGDAFGVDRIDYLLRDSHHAGVAYGRFDHYRLIDTLRILPREWDGSQEPSLGVEGGGLHSAEALLLARYFMYEQLYFHPVRRIYDIHLKDYLQECLPGRVFPVDPERHLDLTDNEVTAAFLTAARQPGSPSHEHARRIVQRQHFKLLYERNAGDANVNPNASQAVATAAIQEFGAENVRHDRYTAKDTGIDFPVLLRDGRVASAQAESQVLGGIPVAAFDYVFISPERSETARTWLRANRDAVIQTGR
jgi:HD superfamily phosphohydrolase